MASCLNVVDGKRASSSHLDLGAIDDEVLAVVGHLSVVHAVHGVVPANRTRINQRQQPVLRVSEARMGVDEETDSGHSNSRERISGTYFESPRNYTVLV